MYSTLSEWLQHLESLHPKVIQLGLDRVLSVKQALGIVQRVPVFIVGGTNGKGSTCAMLERILRCAGYRVGTYTSPHLLAYNERVRINGEPASDEALCAGFAEVEQARGDTALTYFEFGTLGAWQVFERANLDAIVLEVGLGGRLDAVNAFDADCAIVTSIDLDHMDYLGDSRELIGREKAGILRPDRPAIIGDPMPPESLVEYAHSIGARLKVSGRDFGFGGDRQQWGYWRRDPDRLVKRGGLAYPALRGANQLLNASAVITALDAMSDRLPVSLGDIRLGLATVELPGRFQVMPGRPAVIFDVAHNPHAASVLNENLSNMGFFPETWAVLGMLRDKDIAGVLERLKGRVDHWMLCDLGGPRGTPASDIAALIAAGDIPGSVATFSSPVEAWHATRDSVGADDRIVVFGSFLTVAEVMSDYAKSPPPVQG
jgi:dihydrofolate synthase / folylpolyglutamate synthase